MKMATDTLAADICNHLEMEEIQDTQYALAEFNRQVEHRRDELEREFWDKNGKEFAARLAVIKSSLLDEHGRSDLIWDCFKTFAMASELYVARGMVDVVIGH